MLLTNAAEGVEPVGTPIWVPIVIIVILLLLFLWGLFRNSIPEGTAVTHDDHGQDDHDDDDEHEDQHEEHKTAVATRTETPISIEPDDLKKIEGIGPKINSILQAAGINTFADLAAASVSELERIVKHDAGISIAFPDTWPEQAALARDGKWETLEQLQDDLKGGRRA
jgi:predicted flap endonuclease-1-like 5' DNA nuclease